MSDSHESDANKKEEERIKRALTRSSSRGSQSGQQLLTRTSSRGSMAGQTITKAPAAETKTEEAPSKRGVLFSQGEPPKSPKSTEQQPQSPTPASTSASRTTQRGGSPTPAAKRQAIEAEEKKKKEEEQQRAKEQQQKKEAEEKKRRDDEQRAKEQQQSAAKAAESAKNTDKQAGKKEESSEDKQKKETDDLKKKSAAYAIDHIFKPFAGNSKGLVIGVGSGSTVVFAVKRLAELIKEQNIKVEAAIPTSFQAQDLIRQHKLPLGDLNSYPEIDIGFDGADELDANLDCIKGGGGCCFQEKLVAAASKKYYIIAHHEKASSALGEKWKKGVPIEVSPLAYVRVQAELKKIGGEGKLRDAGDKKAGPVVTDNGNFILDTNFGVINNPQDLNQSILKIVGVFETGLFVGMVDKAFIGQQDGNVAEKTKSK